MASGDNEKTEVKCALQHPSILIRKLVELMDHPISGNATQRHMQILKEFLNALHCGFWLQDISYIIRLYEHIVKNQGQFDEFKHPLECLLHFSARLPMRTKASDQIAYERDFQEYFSTLGYLLLCFSDTDLQKLIINAIKNLLTCKSPHGYCCVSIEYCRDIAEKSRLPTILAEALRVIDNDMYPDLLDLMFLVCQLSTAACQKMLEEDALQCLLQRLEPTWKSRYPDIKPKNPSSKDTIPILEDTCCVLWKLLNAVDREKVHVKPPQAFALWSVQYAFRWCTVCPHEKLNRNNLTAIILKIFLVFQDTDFSHTDLFEDIIVISSATGGCYCLSPLVFSEDELDFQFKKIIWPCFYFVRRDVKKDGNPNEMIKVFTMVLCAETSYNKNYIEQYCELAKLIMKIIPKLLNSSLEYENLSRILKKIHRMVEGYLQREYDLELLEAGVYCFKHILSTIKSAVINIPAQETISNITALCNKILESKSLTSTCQKILAHVFCILPIVCQAKGVTNKQVIYSSTDFLQRLIHSTENDPLMDVRVTICAIYCLWECIVAKKVFYRHFLQKGGIYTILDITEASTFPVKSISLGILADIAKKSSSVPYLITWRKLGKKLLPLLLEIFRNKTEKECDNLQHAELVEKQAKNVWLTLCQKQKHYFQSDCISKSQLLKICRFRIDGILNAVKVTFKERVQIANEHYKLFNEKLSAKDEMTQLFAKNFLSLLLCQSWLDVSKQLEIENITPVDADNDILQKKIQGIRQWRSYVRNTIEHIIQEEKQHELSSELQTYITLKEARLSDALDALSELRYISNCTERMFQMRQKLMLQQEIEISRLSNMDMNFHSTITELPFTHIYNQNISIQSNIIYEKKENPCPIAPVSIGDDDPPDSLHSESGFSEPVLEC